MSIVTFDLAADATPVAPALVLTLIVPVFNEQAAIGAFLTAMAPILSQLTPLIRSEILFVNDGSTDGTEFAIRSYMTRDPSIRLVNLSRNFGKEAALCAGLEHASGDAVIPIDVDLQDPPDVIPAMIAKWQQGARIVNARRIDRSSDTWAKRTSAAAFYRVFNALSDHPMPSNVGDFRLLDRQVVDVLRSMGERTRLNKALFAWVGFQTDEVTFERSARCSGKSSMNVWRLWGMALDGIIGSTTKPLRIWTYVGTVLGLLSLLYATYIFVSTLLLGVDVPGYASLVLLVLTFGGLNLFAVGILGEYIGRILTEVRERPMFVVRSVHGADD
ncbi:Glycosyltransferase involved in cell wall bisynthesis [Loktanella fryxellensis]|uniref:Glycosyltransferase involved in cell wall bisynthesis n=1 Tax=Loktanella fryxellensis TaxID=245187 RepID=A0A1H8C641_9RHOB|nr:glycosyltransferase family 2 protein [Loktanella fryxellensis]SEM90526.1 Glycosyltransferase involved in cell wall bisynthesis [Loktanella fryxellensis]